MPTDLISRLSAGRFEGDNAEVLTVLQYAPKDPIWYTSPKPLDSLDDALRLVPPDMTVNMRIHANGEATCVLSDEDSYEDGAQIFPTAPTAVCIAILRAKEADRG